MWRALTWGALLDFVSGGQSSSAVPARIDDQCATPDAIVCGRHAAFSAGMRVLDGRFETPRPRVRLTNESRPRSKRALGRFEFLF